MQVLIAFIIGMAMFANFHPMREIPKNEVQLDIGSQIRFHSGYTQSNPVLVRENVTPLAALTFKNIMKQNLDYSCGSAALATLLDFYLGEDLTERQIINGLVEYGDKYKIAERRAFSFLDMKKFVSKLGYEAGGYKATIDDLMGLKQPCIVPIQFFGYRHFTVFRGIYQGHVFLADPFRGNTSYTVPEFKRMWYDNVLFMINPDGAGTLPNLKLKEGDLRFITEDSINNLILDYGPVIVPPDERYFFFTLPDDYQKYYPN